MSAIVLHHGAGCMDGKVAAYVMSLYLNPIYTDIEYVPVNYNEPIPETAGKHVFIVDFSYTPAVLREMSQRALSITMLDHHLTAAQQWGDYFTDMNLPELACPSYIRLAEHKSGAGLALDYILDHEPDLYNPRLVALVNAVQDRDLWRFEHEDTKLIFEMLNGLEGDFFTEIGKLVHETEQNEYESLLLRAQCAMDLRERLAVEYSAHWSMIRFQGHYIPAVNIPSNFISRVGEILAEKHPCALLYTLTSEKVHCSMRSKKDVGLDVSEICKVFGGGGHRNAAGFRLTIEQLVDLLNGKL